MQDLLVKLQEAERQHQSDRVAFEVRFGIQRESTPSVGLLDTGASDFSWTSCLSGYVPSTGTARL